MSLSTINEIWKLLKPSIEAGDTDGAAETLVHYLIEEEVASAHEIKAAFRGDKDIKDALEFFIETPEDSNFYESKDDDLLDDLFDDADDYYDDDADQY
jgi:hypothetical protein